MKKPRTTSFRGRVLAWLAAHPGESMPQQVAAERWSLSVNTVRTKAYKMRLAGELGPGPDLRAPQ